MGGVDLMMLAAMVEAECAVASARKEVGDWLVIGRRP